MINVQIKHREYMYGYTGDLWAKVERFGEAYKVSTFDPDEDHEVITIMVAPFEELVHGALTFLGV